VEHGAFGAAGHEYRVYRVPCYGADFLLVAFENTEFFHGADVKDADGLITRGACYEVAIRRPGQALDCVFVLMSK